MTGGPPRYRAAVVASLLAEAAFVAAVAMVSGARGMDPWKVVRVPGSFVLGPSAVEPAGFVAGDVVIGVLLHLWLGVAVGLIYAAALRTLDLRPITAGLIAGAILYALGFWALPLVFPGWLAPFWLPPIEKALQAMAHAVYGVVFGFAYARRV